MTQSVNQVLFLPHRHIEIKVWCILEDRGCRKLCMDWLLPFSSQAYCITGLVLGNPLGGKGRISVLPRRTERSSLSIRISNFNYQSLGMMLPHPLTLFSFFQNSFASRGGGHLVKMILHAMFVMGVIGCYD